MGDRDEDHCTSNQKNVLTMWLGTKTHVGRRHEALNTKGGKLGQE